MRPTLDSQVEAFFEASKALPSPGRAVRERRFRVVAYTKAPTKRWDVVPVEDDVPCESCSSSLLIQWRHSLVLAYGQGSICTTASAGKAKAFLAASIGHSRLTSGLHLAW